MQIPKEKKKPFVLDCYQIITQFYKIDVSDSSLSEKFEKNMKTLIEDICNDEYAEQLKEEKG